MNNNSRLVGASANKKVPLENPSSSSSSARSGQGGRSCSQRRRRRRGATSWRMRFSRRGKIRHINFTRGGEGDSAQKRGMRGGGESNQRDISCQDSINPSKDLGGFFKFQHGIYLRSTARGKLLILQTQIMVKGERV